MCALLAKKASIHSQPGVGSTLITSATDLAQGIGPHTHDSLQLVSVSRVHNQVGTAMAFCCDKQLNTVAGAMGVQDKSP